MLPVEKNNESQQNQTRNYASPPSSERSRHPKYHVLSRPLRAYIYIRAPGVSCPLFLALLGARKARPKRIYLGIAHAPASRGEGADMYTYSVYA